jgi:RNase P protein component
MYEAVKPFADSIVPGARLIIFAKEDVSKTKFNELAAEIRALITRSDLVISN